VPGHRPWGLAATRDRIYVAARSAGRLWPSTALPDGGC
jgi:hypothetical protein